MSSTSARPGGLARRLVGVLVAGLTAAATVAALAVPTASAKPPTNEATLKPVWQQEVGASRLHEQGVRGEGQTIALIDTGVTTSGIPDLAGRIRPVLSADGATAVPCVDFSGEHSCEDTYGHGTFLAGLIAGSGAASGGRYAGIAPDAKILSIKIAGRDGSSDVSKVIAALDWVTSNWRTYGITVVNLALGTDSTQPYEVDPLNAAVERAWDAGVVVVAAAGNRGPQPRTISKPGDDPLVITVGAADDRETPATDDDAIPNFSSRGPTADGGRAKPDVVAPGARVVAPIPISTTLDAAIPPSEVVPRPYRRGSGTSMATAVASGGIALLRQAKPTWTPGQVKTAVRASATKVKVTDPTVAGAGLIDAYRASRVTGAPVDANADIARSDGSGLLDASRGTVTVVANCASRTQQLIDRQCGEEIDGEKTASYGTSWYGTSWYGTSWYGTSWYAYTAADGASDDGAGGTTMYGRNAPASAFYGLYE